MNRKRIKLGFSLVELLVAMTIFGILSSASIYGYLSYAKKSNRELVKQALIQDAIKLEKYYSQTGSYIIGGNSWPQGVIESGFIGTGGRVYTISFAPEIPQSANEHRFSLIARPIAGSIQANDSAGNICINQDGTIREHASDNCGVTSNPWLHGASLCSGGVVTSPALATCAYQDSCAHATICGSCSSAWDSSGSIQPIGSCEGSYIGGSCHGDCSNAFIAGNCDGNCTNSIVCGTCSGSHCTGVTQNGCP